MISISKNAYTDTLDDIANTIIHTAYRITVDIDLLM